MLNKGLHSIRVSFCYFCAHWSEILKAWVKLENQATSLEKASRGVSAEAFLLCIVKVTGRVEVYLRGLFQNFCKRG